jgi:hypothetical protein
VSTLPEPAAASASASASPPPPATLADVEGASAEVEGRFLNYVGHQIPWYVRLLWLLFWCLSAWYVIHFLLPALDSELLSPP